jgi:putative ABC transport system substrate-binding protein
MHRRSFLTLLGTAAAAWPLAAKAQQRNVIKRIGSLSMTGEEDPLAQTRNRAFLEAMSKLGWKEGTNLQVDFRAYSTPGNVRRAAAELVASAPDVILCAGTPMAAVFHELTSTVPIVFVNVADPVASGLVASFARPGSNITGFVSVESSLGGKWLSLLRDISPGLTRVLVLYDPANANWKGYLPIIQTAAAAFHINVTPTPVMAFAQVEQALAPFAGQPHGGIIVVPALQLNNRDALAALAARHRLPAIYPYNVYAESGGLASYGSNFVDMYRVAAVYVDRILRGTRPADLPVQAPTKFGVFRESSG